MNKYVLIGIGLSLLFAIVLIILNKDTVPENAPSTKKEEAHPETIEVPLEKHIYEVELITGEVFKSVIPESFNEFGRRCLSLKEYGVRDEDGNQYNSDIVKRHKYIGSEFYGVAVAHRAKSTYYAGFYENIKIIKEEENDDRK